MLRVGLTGGIGSGKSEVVRLLAARGAVIIDADVLSREVVAPGSDGLAEIVAAFGADVLTAEGSLDRPAMGRRVFSDDAARNRLEGIIHPRVRARASDIEMQAGADTIVVHDIPLLVETGQAGDFDQVLVVDVPPETQLQRLTSQRGMSEHEARSRIAAQATRQDRLAAADIVITNDGTLADLRADVDRAWAQLQQAAAAQS